MLAALFVPCHALEMLVDVACRCNAVLSVFCVFSTFLLGFVDLLKAFDSVCQIMKELRISRQKCKFISL